MMSKVEFKQNFPDSECLSPLEQNALREAYTPLGKYRRIAEASLAWIVAGGAEVTTYVLSQSGHIQRADALTYIGAGFVGLAVGYLLGAAVGTIAYETLEKDGEVKALHDQIMGFFHLKNSGSSTLIKLGKP